MPPFYNITNPYLVFCWRYWKSVMSTVKFIHCKSAIKVKFLSAQTKNTFQSKITKLSFKLFEFLTIFSLSNEDGICSGVISFIDCSWKLSADWKMRQYFTSLLRHIMTLQRRLLSNLHSSKLRSPKTSLLIIYECDMFCGF